MAKIKQRARERRAPKAPISRPAPCGWHKYWRMIVQSSDHLDCWSLRGTRDARDGLLYCKIGSFLPLPSLAHYLLESSGTLCAVCSGSRRRRRLRSLLPRWTRASRPCALPCPSSSYNSSNYDVLSYYLSFRTTLGALEDVPDWLIRFPSTVPLLLFLLSNGRKLSSDPFRLTLERILLKRKSRIWRRKSSSNAT